ncbi:MAG: CBS domain-containing protein [Clostridia bacterium]|nr:CBS domain-containing protein [Clostridia bacterium]
MPETDEKSFAERFINAYNTIDHELRIQHDFRRSMSYSDMIRRAVVQNYVVRKYEDELIDYGRLRNAIIHKSNEDYIIAEPHEDVVLQFEKIAKIISAPPKVWNTICKKDVVTVQFDVPLKKVIEIIYTSSFSNLPVYKNGGLIGVANGQKMLNVLGEQVSKGKDINEYISKTKIEDIINQFTNGRYYEVMPMDVTVERALNLFYENRKLLIIILTKTGSMEEVPLGILTTGDIMDMNSLLEKF